MGRAALLLTLAVALLAAGAPITSAATASASGAGGEAPCATNHWVASWSASPTDSFTPFDAAGLPVPAVVTSQTLRMVITPHLGGSDLRIHLSNRFGSQPVTFGHVTVGAQTSGAGVRGIRQVTFGESPMVTVPAGQDVVSDPVALQFAAMTPLAVSMYVPNSLAPPTKHWNANATSYYSPPLSGDRADQTAAAGFPLETEAWFYVDGLDVLAPPATRSIVAFGDSITDGFVAATPLSLPVTTSIANTNGRYPDDLQRRLDAAGISLSVVNAGIGSNKFLTDGEPLFEGLSGLQRFGEDALDQPGVSGVLLLEGINDLGEPPVTATAATIIAGYEQAIVEAHAAGKRIWLGTILPASNALFDGTLLAPQSELAREQINTWIRTQTLSDGVVDFDAALRDPSDPSTLNPIYAGPDNLHPNLAGYQVMADTISLTMLEAAPASC